jgi:hypothetical protein
LGTGYDNAAPKVIPEVCVSYGDKREAVSVVIAGARS